MRWTATGSGKPLNANASTKAARSFGLIGGLPGRSRQVDLVGRGDVLDTGREDDSVPDEGAFLFQHVAEREDDPHGHAPIAFARLG